MNSTATEPAEAQDQDQAGEVTESKPTPIPGPPSDSERIAELRGFSTRIVAKRWAFAQAQSVQKEAKRALEAEQDALETYLRRMDEPQLPFGKDDDGEQGEDLEPWRGELISTLADFGLKPGICETLSARGMETIGDLVDFVKDGRRTLDKIDGIGEARAEQISDALAGFWQRWANDLREEFDGEVAAAVGRVEAEKAEKASKKGRKAG
jgi:hypothetical protein